MVIVRIRDNEYPLLLAAKRVGVAYGKDLVKRAALLFLAALLVALLTLADRVWAVRLFALFLVVHFVQQVYVGGYKVKYYPDHSLMALIVGGALQAGLYGALVYFPLFFWEPFSFVADTAVLFSTAAVIAAMLSLVAVVFQPPFNRKADRLNLCPNCGVVLEITKRRKRVVYQSAEPVATELAPSPVRSLYYETITRCWNCDYYKEALY